MKKAGRSTDRALTKLCEPLEIWLDEHRDPDETHEALLLQLLLTSGLASRGRHLLLVLPSLCAAGVRTVRAAMPPCSVFKYWRRTRSCAARALFGVFPSYSHSQQVEDFYAPAIPICRDSRSQRAPLTCAFHSVQRFWNASESGDEEALGFAKSGRRIGEGVDLDRRASGTAQLSPAVGRRLGSA